MNATVLAVEATKPPWLIAGLLLVVVLGVIDFATGLELSFAPFYVVPIALVTWRMGRAAGLLISLICAAAWLAAELLGGQGYSHPAFHVWNTLIRAASFLGVALLLSTLREALRFEWERARTDFLTGASNARHFYDVVAAEMGRARRHRHALTLAYIDVDDFKLVNDRFGHRSGDQVLRTIAQKLRDCLRRSDVVARLGGDEFAVLLPETDQGAAQALLSRMQARLVEELTHQGWPMTFSIGVVTFAEMPQTVDNMVSMADQLMYSAKCDGKNRMASVRVGVRS